MLTLGIKTGQHSCCYRSTAFYLEIVKRRWLKVRPWRSIVRPLSCRQANCKDSKEIASISFVFESFFFFPPFPFFTFPGLFARILIASFVKDQYWKDRLKEERKQTKKKERPEGFDPTKKRKNNFLRACLHFSGLRFSLRNEMLGG